MTTALEQVRTNATAALYGGIRDLNGDIIKGAMGRLRGLADDFGACTNEEVLSELQKYFGRAKFLGVFGGGEDQSPVQVGGCGCGMTVGGVETGLANYAESVYSKEKEMLIRHIARDVLKILNQKGHEKMNTAPIDTVVKTLRSLIPGGKKGVHFKSEFNTSASNQQNVCRAMAEAINNHYHGKVIPTDASPTEMCNMVNEILNTLLLGLQSEYLSVAADVVRVLKNLSALNEYMEANYKKVMEILKANSDEQAVVEAKEVEAFYEKLRDEVNRQIALLSNMMNVSISPTGNELVKLLNENSELVGMVKDIQGDLGTSEFTKRLSLMLSGFSDVAYAADLVDKNLKKLGMSIKDYASAKKPDDLRSKVYKIVISRSPNSKHLDAMMEAAKIIMNFSAGRHAEISKLLNDGKKGKGEDVPGAEEKKDVEEENKKKKEESPDDGSDDAKSVAGSSEGGFSSDGDLNQVDGEVTGGVDFDEEKYKQLPKYWKKRSLAKKLKDKTDSRKLLLGEFKKVIRNSVREIVEIADNIAKHIGKEIPADDNLDRFITAFSQMASINRENIADVLSGYYKSAVAKQERESIINSYLLVDAVIAPLANGPKGELFRAVQNACKNFVAELDKFQDNVVKALTEIKIDRPADVQKEMMKMSQRLFTGSGGESPFAGHGSFVHLEKVKNELRYFFNIAHIKHNIRAISAEMETFGAEYEQMMGEEAAWMIDSATRLFQKIMTEKKDQPQVVGVLRRMLDAKVQMIKAAQAVDLYMKAFTEQYTKDPDVIKSLLAILEQVEVVARWYDEKSGNNMATLLRRECRTDGSMPKVPGSSAHPYSVGPDKDNNGKPDPKDPRIDISKKGEKSAESIYKLTELTVKTMRALENILSTFRAIGEKFGNVDLSSKTFMSVPQLFKCFQDYIITTTWALDVDSNGALLNLSSVPEITSREMYWWYHTRCPDVQGDDYKNVSVDMYGLPDLFADTDMLFEFSIKSIVSKVIILVDAYRLFHRPIDAKKKIHYYSLHPLRQILGGNDDGKEGGLLNLSRDDYVKVIPEAVELYYRLPLLCEWYRDKFGMNRLEKQNKDSLEIVVIPNTDSIWNEFMEKIFIKFEYITNGNYSESQVREIVNSINNVYKAYKSRYASATPRQIINSFVMEVNRSFGFLFRNDVREYLDQRRSNLSFDNNGNPDEYMDEPDNILDADSVFKSGAAPSDRFVREGPKNLKDATKMEMISLMRHLGYIRTQIDTEFNNYYENNLKSSADKDPKHFEFINIRHHITNTQKELSIAKDDFDRYQIVVKLLQNANKLKEYNVDHYLMLHESVVTPLTVLGAVQLIFSRLNAELHTIWLLKNPPSGTVMDYYKEDINQIISKRIDRLYNAKKSLSPEDSLHLIIIKLEQFCTGSKLVNYSFDSESINIDYSNLQDTCVKLLANVKSNIGNLRTIFDPDTLKQYEEYKSAVDSKGVDRSDLVVTVRNLEEFMVEILFKNRDKTGLPSATHKLNDVLKTVDDKTRQGLVSRLYTYVIYEYNYTNNYTLPFAGFDINRFPFNILPFKIDPDLLQDSEKTAIFALKSQKLSGWKAELKDPSNNAISTDSILNIRSIIFEDEKYINNWNVRWPEVEKDKKTTSSLLLAFNKILMMYLFHNLDESTYKLYMPLIEGFINSSAAYEIIDSNYVPSSLENGKNDKPANLGLPLPKENSVIMEHNALTIRALFQRMDMRLKKKKHAYENFAEIPEYMKTKMRMNLPYYNKLFSIIFEKAQFYVNLLDHNSYSAVVKITSPEADWKMTNATNGLAEVPDAKIAMKNTLNKIMSLCQSIKRCIDGVYKELQDTLPYYLETYPGMLADYKKRTAGLPLISISHILYPLCGLLHQGHPDNENLANALLPTAYHASDIAKYNYGCRVLATRDDIEFNIDYTPGSKQIYNDYLSVTGKNRSITMNDYITTIKNMMALVKMLNNGCVYNKLLIDLSNSESIYVATSIDYRSAGLISTLPYSINETKKIKDVVQNIENFEVRKNKKELQETVFTLTSPYRSAPADRKNLLIENILEMNIVPLNVHAFMREIPFANLMNYAYTFDKMVESFLGRANLVNPFKNNHPPRELFGELLCNPYIMIHNDTDAIRTVVTYRGGSNEYTTASIKGKYYGDLTNMRKDLSKDSPNTIDHYLSSGINRGIDEFAEFDKKYQEFEQRIKQINKSALAINNLDSKKLNQIKDNIKKLNKDLRDIIGQAISIDPAQSANAATQQSGNAATAATTQSADAVDPDLLGDDDIAHFLEGTFNLMSGAFRLLKNGTKAILSKIKNATTGTISYTLDSVKDLISRLKNGVSKFKKDVLDLLDKPENKQTNDDLKNILDSLVNLVESTQPQNQISSDFKRLPFLSELKKLLTGDFDPKDFNNHLLQIGRPKYLEDQLVRKALMLAPGIMKGTPEINVNDYGHGNNIIQNCNSKIVRNVIFLINLQRFTRVILGAHLSWVSEPVVRGLPVIRPQLDNYKYNDSKDAFDEDEFNGKEYELL